MQIFIAFLGSDVFLSILFQTHSTSYTMTTKYFMYIWMTRYVFGDSEEQNFKENFKFQ